jgi:hypothetical protein
MRTCEWGRGVLFFLRTARRSRTIVVVFVLSLDAADRVWPCLQPRRAAVRCLSRDGPLAPTARRSFWPDPAQQPAEAGAALQIQNRVCPRLRCALAATARNSSPSRQHRLQALAQRQPPELRHPLAATAAPCHGVQQLACAADTSASGRQHSLHWPAVPRMRVEHSCRGAVAAGGPQGSVTAHLP